MSPIKDLSNGLHDSNRFWRGVTAMDACTPVPPFLSALSSLGGHCQAGTPQHFHLGLQKSKYQRIIRPKTVKRAGPPVSHPVTRTPATSFSPRQAPPQTLPAADPITMADRPLPSSFDSNE